MVGTAETLNIFLNKALLTAEDSHQLKLVNDVAPADQLQQVAEQKAEYFASKSKIALSTLMVALNNTHLGLSDYLEAIGTGFEAVIKDTSVDHQ